MTEVSKVLSKNQTLQRTRDQILDVPVPQMMEQLGEVPEMVSQGRIQRRTAEQIVDMPVFKIFSRDRVRLRFVQQNIEKPVNEPIPQIVEESVGVVKTVFQKGISEDF